MQIEHGENRLIRVEEPLTQVYHDNTLIGKGTKGSRLRTNGSGIHDSTLFGDGTASQPLTTYTADDILLDENGKGLLTESGEYILVESAIINHGIYDGSGSLADNVTVDLNGKTLLFSYTNGTAALTLDDSSGTIGMSSPNNATYIQISDNTFLLGIGEDASAILTDARVSLSDRVGLQYDNTINFVNSSLISRDYADGLAIGTPNVTIHGSTVVGRYRALLSQSGTNDPVAFVTLNTLDGDIV